MADLLVERLGVSSAGPPRHGVLHPLPLTSPATVSLPLEVVRRGRPLGLVIWRASPGVSITQLTFRMQLRFVVTGNRSFLKGNVGIRCTSFLFLTLFQILENVKQ